MICLKERLIFGFRRRNGRRRVEVFFEAGLKKRIVTDVPAFSVPSGNIAARVEEGDVLPKKARARPRWSSMVRPSCQKRGRSERSRRAEAQSEGVELGGRPAAEAHFEPPGNRFLGQERQLRWPTILPTRAS